VVFVLNIFDIGVNTLKPFRFISKRTKPVGVKVICASVGAGLHVMSLFKIAFSVNCGATVITLLVLVQLLASLQ
jgi:hypothetical protein